MVAAKGNNYRTKFKTPKQRQDAYKAFCDHIAQGLSKKSFHKPCVENTILKMMKDHPEDCPAEMLEEAEAEGRLVWEKLGMAGAMGRIAGFNASAWIFNMKNRLGWKDKTEVGFDKDARAVFKLSMGKALAPKPDETD